MGGDLLSIGIAIGGWGRPRGVHGGVSVAWCMAAGLNCDKDCCISPQPGPEDVRWTQRRVVGGRCCERKGADARAHASLQEGGSRSGLASGDP